MAIHMKTGLSWADTLVSDTSWMDITLLVSPNIYLFFVCPSLLPGATIGLRYCVVQFQDKSYWFLLDKQ